VHIFGPVRETKNNLRFTELYCVISGFRRGVRSSLFWDVIQRRLVVSNLRFRTAYRSHLGGPTFRGQETQEELGLFDLWRQDRSDVPRRRLL